MNRHERTLNGFDMWNLNRFANKEHWQVDSLDTRRPSYQCHAKVRESTLLTRVERQRGTERKTHKGTNIADEMNANDW